MMLIGIGLGFIAIVYIVLYLDYRITRHNDRGEFKGHDRRRF